MTRLTGRGIGDRYLAALLITGTLMLTTSGTAHPTHHGGTAADDPEAIAALGR